MCEILDRVKQAFRDKARAEAAYIRALADYATEYEPTRTGTQIADGAPEQIAIELDMSPHKATVEILLARDLVTRLPRTVEALESGVIDFPRAKAVRDYTQPLDAEQAAEVERRVLDKGGRDNQTKFKFALGKEVIRVDPEGAKIRRAEVKARRDVTKWHKHDGPTAVTAYLEPHQAELAYSMIDVLAHSAETPTRSRAQCRADAFMDLSAPRSVLLYPRFSREELKGGSWA